MESFKFSDKITKKEYMLPRYIQTLDGVDLNLQELLGHVISYSRKINKSRSQTLTAPSAELAEK